MTARGRRQLPGQTLAAGPRSWQPTLKSRSVLLKLSRLAGTRRMPSEGLATSPTFSHCTVPARTRFRTRQAFFCSFVFGFLGPARAHEGWPQQAWPQALPQRSPAKKFATCSRAQTVKTAPPRNCHPSHLKKAALPHAPSKACRQPQRASAWS